MSDMPVVPAIEVGTYQHYKDKLYQVLGTALHSETLEVLVVYKPLYKSDAEFWVRPYHMFIEQIEVDGASVPRFKKVSD